MKYDFEHAPNRKGTSCYKYDSVKGDLPMWVADMDFVTAPEILEALSKRLSHGVFGYAMIPTSWNEAYRRYFKDRYGWEFKNEDMAFCLGVVPVLSCTVRALTKEGDNVVILPPVYNVFYASIRNNKRVVCEVPLIEKEGQFYIDFGKIEAAFASPKTSLCILCNPGNPTARIWSKEELNELASLARKHGVTILSDEIHGPLTRPGKDYVPFLLADPHNKDVGFAAISPTKSFNLAGIHTAAIVSPNHAYLKQMTTQFNTDEVGEPNVFSCVAAEAAWNKGREWLEECRKVLFDNRDYATTFINENIPGLYAYEGDATYLLWVDHKEVEPDTAKLLAYLEEKQGLVFNDGPHYGSGGESHLRINLACPRSTLEEGLRRLKEGIAEYRK